MMRQKYVVSNILEEFYVEDTQLVTTSVGREEKVITSSVITVARK